VKIQEIDCVLLCEVTLSPLHASGMHCKTLGIKASVITKMSSVTPGVRGHFCITESIGKTPHGLITLHRHTA